MINYELILKYLPFLLQGAINTLYIAAFGCFLGFTLGTLLALAQTNGSRMLKWFVSLFVTLIRGTPMLIQIAFFYYAIMPTLGLHLTPITAAIIAIGINSSAYISQIVRSGINSINKGQLEAARTLGLSTGQMIHYIILPQAIQIVLPALGNEFITLIKDSSLAYTIGVVELYKQGITMRTQTLDAMSTYVGVALIYLIMTTLVSLLMSYLEKTMCIKRTQN